MTKLEDTFNKVCLSDLKICEDGSISNRDPMNNCEFKACPKPKETKEPKEPKKKAQEEAPKKKAQEEAPKKKKEEEPKKKAQQEAPKKKKEEEPKKKKEEEPKKKAQEEEAPKVCAYDKSIHYGEKADEYHISKCVKDTMQKMGDIDSCTSYMSGIMQINEKTKYCTIKDIHKICEKNKSDFSVDDAMKLCRAENEAAKKFWMSKK